MKVIAKERGFYKGVQRERGDVFDFDFEEDAKRAYKRDADGKLIRDDLTDELIRDEDGEQSLPVWLAEVDDDSVQEHSKTPASHPKLDKTGRPYPYSVPFADPGVDLPMDRVAEANADVAQEFSDENDADRAKREEALAKADLENEGGVADKEFEEFEEPKASKKRSKK